MKVEQSAVAEEIRAITQEGESERAPSLRESWSPEHRQHDRGIDYLMTMPRRVVTIYMPIAIFLVVLLFPFYWMGTTSIKSNQELLDLHFQNPLWVHSPTLDNFRSLLFDTEYPSWMWNTMMVALVATSLSLVASIMASYAIVRIRFAGWRWMGSLIFLAYLVPPSILFIPLATMVFKYGLFDSPMALILVYPTILIPFSTWLLIGYFKSIPYELEECALIDGASRMQILTKIVLPLSVPGIISAGIFSFTLCWNEFIYALTFISSSENKTVPVGVLSELVDGDIYHWGSLMAGALLGSLPVALIYSFFVQHYVASMTGSVKA
jgi:multiple sugar transport system permease protein